MPWTTKALLSIATDLTMASEINRPKSLTRRAVDSRIAPVAAGIIADDPSVVAEAAALAQSDAGLMRLTDPGAPSVSVETYTHRLVDAWGRATWLEAVESDGGPSEWSVQLIRDRLQGEFFGGALAADISWTPGMRVAPNVVRVTRISGWGSSTVAGLATAMGAFATGVGATYFNGGYSGHVVQDIAAHQGSMPYRVEEFTLPVSGTSPVTVAAPAVHRAFSVTGVLSGVHGVLSKPTGESAGWSFTATVPPLSMVEVAAGQLVPDDVAERDAVAIFNPAKNDLAMNVGYYLSVQECITLTHRMIDFQVARNVEFRVLTHFFDRDLPAVSPVRDRVAAWNEAMIDAYGSLVLRMDSYVASEQIYADAGVTRTTADDAQIALGNKGPSISTDALHLTAAASSAVVTNLVGPSLAGLYV